MNTTGNTTQNEVMKQHLIIIIILGKREQAMKLLIMQFPSASYYFMPLEDKYSPQHLLLKYSQVPVLPLTFRDEVLHPHKATGKITVSRYNNLSFN
jgi:hypothetical protein